MNRVIGALVCLLLGAYALAQKPMTDQQWANYAIKQYRLTGIKSIKSTESRSRKQIALIAVLSYKALADMGDRCDKKISDLSKLVDEHFAKPEDEQERSVAKLRDLMQGLRAEVAELRNLSEDSVRMLRLAKAYSHEIDALGIDRKTMISELSSYQKRITCRDWK